MSWIFRVMDSLNLEERAGSCVTLTFLGARVMRKVSPTNDQH